MTIVCKVCEKTPIPKAIESKLLYGDIFLQFTCEACSPTKAPIYERLPMNWVDIIHLVLYHLHHAEIKSNYFRWKEDICRVIEEHWDELCPARPKSSNWMNSISSILSANHQLFESGFMEMKQSGWWCLKERVAPRMPEATADGRKRRGQAAIIEIDPEGNVTGAVVAGAASAHGADSDKTEKSEKRSSPERSPKRAKTAESPPKHPKRSPPKAAPVAPVAPLVPQQAPLIPPLSPGKKILPAPAHFTPSAAPTAPSTALPPSAPPAPQKQVPLPQPPVLPPKPANPMVHPHGQQMPPRPQMVPPPSNAPVLTAEQQARKNLLAANEIKRKLVERLLRVDSSILKAALSKEADEASKTLNPIMYIPPAMKAGAVSKPSADDHHHLDAKKEKKRLPRPANYVRASPHENELVDVCSKIVNPDERINRLKRKLALRRHKRMAGIPLFDLDNQIYLYLKASEPLAILPEATGPLVEHLKQLGSSAVDGQQAHHLLLNPEGASEMVESELNDVPYLKDPSLSFRAKLMGVTNLAGYPWPLESPYTGNTLPVYLHRETEHLPPKAKLMHAIRSLNNSGEDDAGPASIDFMHLRKEHVPQLNRLLRDAFWPNIDVSESLEYPDYSVVLLYGKLVIGCGLVSPEGYLAYLYVHPEWRAHGLASHLLHMLAARLLPPGCDLTAHVAVGNPAVLLYQRFAFKPEEFIVDFYAGKFVQAEGGEGDGLGPAMRNAFFMRLKR